MKKNPYLVNQYLKNYLSASIATMAIANLNGIVDGLVMGRLLGPDALSAINLSLPILNIIAALGLLVGGGASVVAARALSKHDNAGAGSAYTAAIVGLVFTGTVMAVLSPFISGPVAEIVSVAPELLELSKSYITVLIAGSGFVITSASLMALVEVAGRPMLVTKCAVVNAVVNAVMDVFLVGVLEVGIGGAAMAMVISSLASIVLLAMYLRSDQSPYVFNLKNTNLLASIKENSLQGIPELISASTITILLLVCNYYVQLAQGAEGMFVMSIGIMTISLSFMMVGGSSTAFVAIGSMLLGRDDYKGLYMLFKRAFWISMLSPILFAVASLGFPRQIAMVFGADSEYILDLVASNLPMMACFTWALCLNIYMATVYQVIRKLSLCVPVMASAPLLVCISQAAVANFVSLEYVWYSFLVAGIASILLTVVMAEIVRKKSKEKLKVFCLLPEDRNDVLELNASIPCTKAGVGEEITRLFEMCERAGLGDLGNKIVLCLEELSLNIVEHSGRIENSFIDVYIIIKDHEVRAYLQDNGIAFDPVSVEADKRSVGLKLLHTYCKDMKYNYAFGQNVTHLKWAR